MDQKKTKSEILLERIRKEQRINKIDTIAAYIGVGVTTAINISAILTNESTSNTIVRDLSTSLFIATTIGVASGVLSKLAFNRVIPRSSLTLRDKAFLSNLESYITESKRGQDLKEFSWYKKLLNEERDSILLEKCVEECAKKRDAFLIPLEIIISTMKTKAAKEIAYNTIDECLSTHTTYDLQKYMNTNILKLSDLNAIAHYAISNGKLKIAEKTVDIIKKGTFRKDNAYYISSSKIKTSYVNGILKQIAAAYIIRGNAEDLAIASYLCRETKDADFLTNDLPNAYRKIGDHAMAATVSADGLQMQQAIK